ncbi:MAG: hypothetical protein CMH85_12405 [Novosphingobium sp.]|nr:hypothetical protein [Novosphingobium sp.]
MADKALRRGGIAAKETREKGQKHKNAPTVRLPVALVRQVDCQPSGWVISSFVMGSSSGELMGAFGLVHFLDWFRGLVME